VAETDDGLRYLDWLRGGLKPGGWRGKVKAALDAYCEDPSIAREIEKVIDGRDS